MSALMRAWTLWICLLIPLQVCAGVTIKTQTLDLAFNRQGSLVRADICYPDCAHPLVRRLGLRQAEGIVSFGQAPGGIWIQRPASTPQHEGDSRQLHFTGPGGQSITWIIPARGYRIEARVAHSGALVLRAGAGFGPRPAAGFGGWLEQVRYVAIGPDGVRQIGLDEEKSSTITGGWAGFRNRFWTVLARGNPGLAFNLQSGADNHEAVLSQTVGLQREQLDFYLGPVEPDALRAVDKHLGELLYAGLWSWLRWICFGLFRLLGWIQSLVPDWGAAIMLLSLAVNILMLPLSRMAERVQHQVHATEARLAPELSRIKKSLRGEEQAEAMMALYKSEGVNPLYSLKSLLGVAIVIPVFIGAFDMLAENIHLLNTGFLWIRDLSRPDALMQLPFRLPFFGADLNLLPFLMTGFSVVASWLHRPPALSEELRGRQVRNMLLLALAFFALFYTFPAGMVLYWTSNNLISVGRSLWARRRRADSVGG